MNWPDLKLRLRSLRRRGPVEDELEEEFRTHLAMQAQKNQAKGLDPTEAERLARLQFGAVESLKEECRDVRGTRLIEDTLADVRYALRTFGRMPAFVLAVVSTIALPLGLNTALFTIFDAYVLRTVAIRDPGSVYEYTWTNRNGTGHSFSWPEFQALRHGVPVFSDVAATNSLFARVEGYPLFGEFVTANYFPMLGVNAVAGRTLLPEDGSTPGAAPVIVLSHNAWRNKLGGDPEIIGKSIMVRGRLLQVVGIVQAGFAGLGGAPRDFWVPITMAGQLEDAPDLFSAGHPNRLKIVGRLKNDVTYRQAEAALEVWAHNTTNGNSQDDRAVGIVLESRATPIVLTPQLLATAMPVFVAFLLILLIACSNIASMMLARAIARQREIGVRLALGAARMRLLRQLLTESLVLAVPSAIAGLVLSEAVLHFGQKALLAAMPADLAKVVTITSLQPDIRVFGFLVIATALSAILFGIAPALQATRLDVSQATRGEFTANLRPARFRNALVIGQITACAMLLTCAVQSLRVSARMGAQEVGFATRGILGLDVNEKYRARVLAQLAEEPSLQLIAAAQSIPLNGKLPSVPVIANSGRTIRAAYNFVSPDFFRVLDISIRSGRSFSPTEAQAGEAVAIVSRKTAENLWPGQQALGQTLQIAPESRVALESKVRRFPKVRIIGVSDDIVSCCMTLGVDPALVYLPTTSASAGTGLLLRVYGSSERVRQALDTKMAAISPSAIDQIHTMETFQAAGVFPFRVAAAVCMVIGGLALLLALSGVYGVLSYAVSQRTREIGIRMAIGASTASVAGLVILQSMRLAVIGSVAGAVLALGVCRLLASRVFFMKSFEPLAFLIGVAVPLAAAAVAACVPARRAALVEPTTALRHD